MKSVIVTGATSYIAVALINKLVKQGVKVYAIVRPQTQNLYKLPCSPSIEVIELGMQDAKRILNYGLGNIQAVYHFAWEGVRGNQRNDSILQEKNYEAAKSWIDMAIEMQIPYFIGMGSQAEYGITEGVVTEATRPKPDSEYGKQKLRVYGYGMDRCIQEVTTFIWARIFSVYGHGENPNTLIMQCLDKMQRNEAIDLSPCEHQWDYLYIEDAAEALFCLWNCNPRLGAYNIAYGEPRKLKDYIVQMRSILQSESKLRFGAIPYGDKPPAELNPDISKIQQEIGWMPQIEFEAGIRKIVEERANEQN